MITHELAALETDLLERIRIIGPKSAVDLPEQLSPLLMPYTNQLNDPRLPIHGTEFDFAARAAAHFVDVIGVCCRGDSIEGHKKAVRGALATLVMPEAPSRANIGDTQLRHLIASFKREKTPQGKALRRLRDEFRYCCGTEHFDLLWGTSE
jgi:hypothetical protein